MQKQRIINLTPHPVTLMLENGMKVTFDTSDSVARVFDEETIVDYVTHESAGMVITIPVERYNASCIHGLPEPTEGITYIVSSQVARVAVATGRVDTDLVCPKVDSSAVRDENNRVIAVRGLRKW